MLIIVGVAPIVIECGSGAIDSVSVNYAAQSRTPGPAVMSQGKQSKCFVSVSVISGEATKSSLLVSFAQAPVHRYNLHITAQIYIIDNISMFNGLLLLVYFAFILHSVVGGLNAISTRLLCCLNLQAYENG